MRFLKRDCHKTDERPWKTAAVVQQYSRCPTCRDRQNCKFVLPLHGHREALHFKLLNKEILGLFKMTNHD